MGYRMTFCRAWRRAFSSAVLFPLGLFLLVCATPAFGTDWTFNWGTLGWSPTGPGSMPRLYTNVAGSGIDVRVRITSNNTTWLNGTPLLNNSPGQGNELSFQVDFANISNNPKVTNLFEFFVTGTGQTTRASVAVTGIATRDIDLGSYRDVVTVTGVNAGGATVDPDFISQYVATPNWAVGAGGGTCTGCTNANTVHATGAGVNPNDPAGWAAFNFTSTKVRSMAVVYSAGDGNGSANPSQQFVWLSNFVFSDTVIATQAVISSFGVRADGTVEWETASEVGTAGFNLLRRDPATGRYVRLNERLLPALIGAPRGGVYRYADEDVVPGESYTYGLEEVEATGTLRRYGPFVVTAGARGTTPEALPPRARAAAVGGAPARPGGYTRQARLPDGRHAEGVAGVRVATTVRAQATSSEKAASSAKSNSAVRILVEEEGLYAVTADQISAALGANLQQVRTWIGKGQLRLQQKGDPVAWMGDPGSDRLYFYGQAPTGADATYTRHNVYWLDRANGLEMKAVNGKAPAPAVAGQSFRSRVHAEENNCPVTFVATDPDDDFWYANAVQVSASGQHHVAANCYDLLDGPPAFAVSAPDSVAAGTATLRAYLQGATDLAPGNDHHARVRVNGTEVGSVAWDGIAAQTLTATFDAGLLAADGNNTVIVEGTLAPGAETGVFWVDGFDLDYPRAYRASGDQLRFNGNGDRVVTVGGFGGSYIPVLDIGDPRKPQWLAATTVTPDGARYAVSVASTKSDGDYLAAVPKAPVAVEGVSLPALKSKDSEYAARYLVLTPRSLRAGADVLAAYRGAKVVELEDIYDAFSYGIANPGAIRDFLAYAYQNWKPKPRYVALVGKGTIDPKDYMGYGTNRFPVLMSPTPHGLFASDNRYVDFDGNGVPDLAIGRISALASADVIDYVGKLRTYDGGSARANQALVVTDVPDEGGDFKANGRAVAQALEAGGIHASTVDLADSLVTNARAAIFARLNPPGGVGLFNYIGHGGANLLSKEAVFTNGDVSLLTNAAQLPVFLAFTCAAGDGTYPGYDSLAETLLWRQGGGAVASIAPTGLSDNGQAHTLNLGLVDALIGPRASATLGEANAAALADLARKGGERYMLDKYSVTGDPALRVQR